MLAFRRISSVSIYENFWQFRFDRHVSFLNHNSKITIYRVDRSRGNTHRNLKHGAEKTIFVSRRALHTDKDFTPLFVTKDESIMGANNGIVYRYSHISDAIKRRRTINT